MAMRVLGIRPLPLLAVLGALLVVALLSFGVVNAQTGTLEVGKPMPDATLPRLDGEGSGSIADHRGKWVLVNLWASWCDPCREEAPDLQAFHERHRDDGVVVLGIDSRDLTPDARAFVDEYELTYPMLRDGDGSFSERLAATGFPETFLVDPQGILRLVRRGPVDEAYLERFVEPAVTGELAAGRPQGGAR